MSERAIIATTALVGAGVGALAGYLLFTPAGRQASAEIERWFDNVMDEFVRLSRVAGRVGQFANEGLREWQAVRSFQQNPSSPS